MKILQLLTAALLLLPLCSAHAQSGEFTKNDNGLIYSDKAIGKLQHIVDSLNLKFKSCDNKTFYTVLQQEAQVITISGKDATRLKANIDAANSFENVRKKYPDSAFQSAVAVRRIYKDYRDEDVVNFSLLTPNGDDNYMGFKKDERQKALDFKQGWLYTYHAETEYDEEHITAIYLKEPLRSIPLPNKYSRLALYSECMVDTVATIYFEKEKITRRFDSKGYEELEKFHSYVNSKLKRPEFNLPKPKKSKKDKKRSISKADYNISVADTTIVDTTVAYADDYDSTYYKKYYESLSKWESKKLVRLDKLLKKDKKLSAWFKDLYAKIKMDSITSDDEIEEYVARYISPEESLRLKRSRRVIGGCSMDDRPRRHAFAIAELAGETANWEIFLRAHLDIMNDRFDRVSDGSYAQGGRKTYIKELEILDIDVASLLLGISLRIENPSENHYFGNIVRIGRSLAEFKDRKLIEKDILAMVKDDTLDSYNRLLMYYLFFNYNGFINDEDERQANDAVLVAAAQTLPVYIRPQINNE